MKSKRFVIFPPYNPQFYFSSDLYNYDNRNSLFYHPYNKIAALVWLVMLRFTFINRLTSLPFKNLPDHVKQIIARIDLPQASFQINCGTKGPDQKLTVIRHQDSKEEFFKIAYSERGNELVKNEFEILSSLKGKFNSPLAIDYYMHNEYCYLQTQKIEAEKFKYNQIGIDVFNVLLSISSHEISQVNEFVYAFQHGDFCPWNLLKNGAVIHVIDWELAGQYPLGFDLFTYIFQTSFLLQPDLSNAEIFASNKTWLNKYFNNFKVESWVDYLNAFIAIKLKHEGKKDVSSLLYKKYKLLESELKSNMV